MAKQTERHQISDDAHIFKQSNSKWWYARFQVEGKWYSRATKQLDKLKAIDIAYRMMVEYQIRHQTGTLISSKQFKDVAEKAIQTMEAELYRGTGKVIYKDYILVLRKYHIPFFDRTPITSIDSDILREFDKWRIEKIGREPAKSTILNHNAAMQMVFKEAVENKWMLHNQIPGLSVKGTNTVRRASLTPADFEQVMDHLYELETNGRKEITRQIRELTQDYAEFVIYTGMRPGTEVDNLTWSDLHIERHGDKATFFISIRKGKTTIHTGTREVVCKRAIQNTILRLTERFPNRKPQDAIFCLPDGSVTNEIGRTFNNALKDLGLDKSPYGKRTLYSLRHSFITWELIAQSVTIDVLARQCGTSIEMIEKHYSHVIPRMFSQQLSGVDMPKKEEIEQKWKNGEKLSRLWEKRFTLWEKNYKSRGSI
ncbi:site-specific integrase [Rheinheimera sp. D18]|uniref:tyrosine-type recombinase/integrase n=1 Tax=Rheinheimera sp. D18 TaxID=2545632 RepID=UPI0010429AD2|nr:tyrosine-type recombinase/integrase [Rheinheimera sp. D18]QBL08420.1 site-specific integrase [Rheinheimera sp. D18]